MNMKKPSLLLLLEKLRKDAPAAKILGIAHHDGLNLHTPSQMNDPILLQTADVFVRKDYKLAPLHPNSFYRHARALLDTFYVRRLQQDSEKFSTFALFHNTKIRQTKNTFHSISLQFMTTMRPFSCDARDKVKMWEEKPWMRGKRLVMKVEGHFSSAESASIKQGFLDESALSDTLRKKSVWKK